MEATGKTPVWVRLLTRAGGTNPRNLIKISLATVCHKCKKNGHFNSVCRSVNELHTDSDSESNSDIDTKTFVGVITRGDETPWSITIFVNDTPINFEIDTGAEVSVISTKTYKEIGSPSLTAPTKSLHGPSSKKLSVKGSQ